MLTEEEKYKIASEKVRKMKKFYKHLSSFMFTSIFLMVLFFFLRLPPWITFVVVAGWGIGIASEALEVFGFPGSGRSWEERKIEEEMAKMDEPYVKTFPDDLTDEVPEDKLEEEERLELPDYKPVRRNWDESDFV